MSLSLDGNFILGGYVALNKAMENDRYMFELCIIHACNAQILISLLNYCKSKMKLQPRVITCMYRSLPRGEYHIILQTACFAQKFEKTGIYQSCTCHIFSAVRLLVCLVSAAHRVFSVLACLRILSVFATESPPIRGLTLPNFYSQVLIS